MIFIYLFKTHRNDNVNCRNYSVLVEVEEITLIFFEHKCYQKECFNESVIGFLLCGEHLWIYHNIY